MTCAKKVVRCFIWTDGDPGELVAVGENWCRNPQDVCPREEGEGYEKCKTICDQVGHAEEVALIAVRAVDIDIRGGTALFAGHRYACASCQEQLYDAGIKYIGRIEP